MRIFQYDEYDPDHPDGGYTATVSEEDIRKSYYPYWYGKMVEKFGKSIVDYGYSFEDCVQDWVVVNWAREVKDV